VRAVLASLPQTAPVPKPDASVPESQLELSSQMSASAALHNIKETLDDRTSPPVRTDYEQTAVTSPPLRPSRPDLPGLPAELPHGSQPEGASPVGQEDDELPSELGTYEFQPAPPSASRPALPGMPAPKSLTPTPPPVPHEFPRAATPVPPTSHGAEPTLVEVPNLRGARPDERYFPTEAVDRLSRRGAEWLVDTSPVPKQGIGLSWQSMLTIVVVAMVVLILIALL
jgi:hypothetical protein